MKITINPAPAPKRLTFAEVPVGRWFTQNSTCGLSKAMLKTSAHEAWSPNHGIVEASVALYSDVSCRTLLTPVEMIFERRES